MCRRYDLRLELVGQAPNKAGDRYGAHSVAVMHQEMRKIPLSTWDSVTSQRMDRNKEFVGLGKRPCSLGNLTLLIKCQESAVLENIFLQLLPDTQPWEGLGVFSTDVKRLHSSASYRRHTSLFWLDGGSVDMSSECSFDVGAAFGAYEDDRIRSVSLEEYERREAGNPFSELITEQTKATFAEQGLLHHLLPFDPPIYRRFLDEPTFPCIMVDPNLSDVEAIEDLQERAEAIFLLNIRGTDERSIELIQSVAGAGMVGDVVQGGLLPLEPQRKVYPWWYTPRQPYRPDPFPSNLFEMFPAEAADDEG